MSLKQAKKQTFIFKGREKMTFRFDAALCVGTESMERRALCLPELFSLTFCGIFLKGTQTSS